MTGDGRQNHKLPVRVLTCAVALVALLSIACGVESGDRRPARQGESETVEFHRTPVTAFEQFRMNMTKGDTSCTIDPNEVIVSMGDRVRLAIQLPIGEGQMAQGTTGSIVVSGEKQSLQFRIDGLQMSASGGAFGTGKTEFDIELESGARKTYDFNAANSGAFDMLCDGAKIGTFTVNPA